MASEVESPSVSALFLLPKTKGGSTPLRSGRHDIPFGNFGYINPGIALGPFKVAAPRSSRQMPSLHLLGVLVVASTGALQLRDTSSLVLLHLRMP
jgi:hypothetical protein